ARHALRRAHRLPVRGRGGGADRARRGRAALPARDAPRAVRRAMSDLVLVTGATGFVGSAVARLLLAAGARGRVLARPRSDRRNLAGLDVEIAEGDLLEAEGLGRACRGCSALFHVAADYRLWTPKPAELYAANVDG